MKEKMLRQKIQLKKIDIEDRQEVCKIRLDKKSPKLIDRAKKAAKERINEFWETLVTTNEVIYAGAYVTTAKLNGKPKNSLYGKLKQRNKSMKPEENLSF